MHSFPAYAGMVVGLILHKSYIGNHNHLVFTSAVILPCPEDAVLLTSDFFNLSALLFHKVSGNRCDIEFMLMAEHSTDTCSPWFGKL